MSKMAILDFFIHNAMSEIFSDNSTSVCQAYLKTLRIDIKNTTIYMPLLCRKWYQFSAWPWLPSWIFYQQCFVWNIFRQHHYVRHIWKLQDSHQKHEYASIMSKMIAIVCLTLDKWRPFWIFFTNYYSVENYVNLKFDLGQMAAILEKNDFWVTL